MKGQVVEVKKTFSISDLQEKLAEIEAEASKIKKMINVFCDLAGEPPMYTDADLEHSKPVNTKLRGDEYHGRPQATAVTEILESRKTRGLGPASIDELYDELVAGGHQFKGKTDQIQKRGLAIALSKNSKFYRLPNEKWGMKEWYPNAKKLKSTDDNQSVNDTETENNDSESENNE